MKTTILTRGEKNLKISLMLLVVFTVINCSKDDTPSPVVTIPLQDPLPGFFQTSGLNETILPIIDSEQFENGFSFYPTVDGKLTAIVLKIPAIENNIRVTVWDKTSATILRTEFINYQSADLEVIKEVEPLSLVKDKEYILSFNSDDYYRRSKSNLLKIEYPVTVGDIVITSFVEKYTNSQTIPTIAPVKYYFYGDCSFKFQK